ncbi:MAG: UDP-N-acetylmuramate dehydrogenase [Calditrichaeota bacterium]|nr:UDP-N-acetylmuramate dehydrogenase [Calditrichota bacterium]
MNISFPQKFHVRQNVALSEYTSIRVGGKAAFLSEINDQNSFIELFQFCLQENIRLLTLGGGTNVFFPESGFDGLVAIIKFNNITVHADDSVTAEAGASLSALNRVCVDHALTGFEFSSGIPGTVGGAIYGNAGAYGRSVSDCLIAAKILTPKGKVQNVENNYFHFSYRASQLKKNGAILLEAEFQLQKGEMAEIKKRVDEILALRRKKLPPADVATAGSYFKNILDEHGNKTAAAVFLDAVDSKQTSVGDAAVHQKHANIFYNRGHATASDLLRLEEILKQRVLDKFGIRLKREVMYIE